ncbi:MAG: rod shape-determining protein MreD [Rhodospirillales bacterium]|nr:rod shape-determining protein MreD [Rhodospirillales bacterium]
MKPTLFQRMDMWARNLLPVGMTLMLLLVNVAPTRIPGFAGLVPVLTLMSVFYWAIYRPDLMPAYAAFMVGLLYDVISGIPIGVNALVCLLVHGVTVSQRRFFLGNTFVVTWWAFAVIAAGAAIISWLLVAVLVSFSIRGKAVMFEYLMTISLYPLVSWLLARTQVAFLKPA